MATSQSKEKSYKNYYYPFFFLDESAYPIRSMSESAGFRNICHFLRSPRPQNYFHNCKQASIFAETQLKRLTSWQSLKNSINILTEPWNKTSEAAILVNTIKDQIYTTISYRIRKCRCKINNNKKIKMATKELSRFLKWIDALLFRSLSLYQSSFSLFFKYLVYDSPDQVPKTFLFLSHTSVLYSIS